MSTPSHAERTVSALDLARLSRLPALHGHDALPAELDAAEVRRPREIPSDVVTMRSTVECIDHASGARQRITLCYPGDADASAGRVSVLSPLGTSLLGRRVGDTVRWLTPDGSTRACTLAALAYQPESAGDFDL